MFNFYPYLKLLIVVGVLIVLLSVFSIICWWKILAKAGEKGWKILIPIYNYYCEYRLMWSLKAFWIMFLITVVGNIIMQFRHPVCIVISLAFGLASVIINIIFRIKLSEAFGKGAGFAIGLIFLPLIFDAILAFGGAEYIRYDKAIQDINPEEQMSI